MMTSSVIMIERLVDEGNPTFSGAWLMKDTFKYQVIPWMLVWLGAYRGLS